MGTNKENPAFGRHAGLLKGTVILGSAAMLSKLIGTMQKIPLQNLAGDSVFGIYNAVYPFYTLLLFVASAGLPVAVSTFVSERYARRQYAEARKIFRLALGILTATGVIFFLLLYFGAGTIADFIGVPATEPAIRSISFALLIVPAMSVFRGYFQGLQNMLPTAVSQVAEQCVRVVTMILLLFYLTGAGYDDSDVAAGATFGSVTGAAAGLIVMVVFWTVYLRSEPKYAKQAETMTAAPVLIRQFAAYALPVCLGSIVLPMLTIVDTFTMPRLLQERTGSDISAMEQFGLYNHGMPLVQLVTMMAASMAAVLVPSVAAAKELKQVSLIRRRTDLALRLSWLVSLAAAFGLAVTAVPMNVMFYKSAEGSSTMAILAFVSIFGTLNIVSASILQGFGAVKAPAVHMLAAAAVKVAGNVLLIPMWGIDGAAAAAVLAFFVAGALNMLKIRRYTGTVFSLKANLPKPLLAVTAMCAAIVIYMYSCRVILDWLVPAVPDRLGATVVALGAVSVGVIVYPAALLRLEASISDDLKLLPHFDSRIRPWLVRLRLVR